MYLTSIIAGIAALGWVRQAQPMSLNEAITVAEKNAYTLQLAQNNVEKSRFLVKEAKGATGLRLNAGTTYTRFDKALTSNFGGTPVTTRAIDAWQSTLAASVTFDLGGTLQALLAAAKYTLKAEELQFEVERSGLKFQVRQAYFQVLQAEESEQIFDDALKLAKARESWIDKQLREGQVARVDLVRAQTQVKQSENDLIAAKNRTQRAKSFFNNVLSRPIETPVVLSKVEDPMLPVFGFDTMLQVAYQSRYEIKALDQQAATLGQLTRAQRGGLKPSVSASIQYSRDWDPQGFGSATNSTVGVLALNVPILDSGITKARVEAAKRDEEQLKIRTQQTKQFIALETKQALLNLDDALSRITVAEKRVELATENYRLARIRAEAGEGINLEVVDAQNELTAAKISLITAQYDLRIAFADLQRALGTDTWPSEGK